MTVTKSIRLTPEELSKWDSKTIHQFLKNGHSNCKTCVKHSAHIEELKRIVEDLSYFKQKFTEFGERGAIKLFKSKLSEDDITWLSKL